VHIRTTGRKTCGHRFADVHGVKRIFLLHAYAEKPLRVRGAGEIVVFHHGGNMELCKTGCVTQVEVVELLYCENMNRELIGRASRRMEVWNARRPGRDWAFITVISVIHWAATSRLVEQARAPTYRCRLFSTIHHVNCPNCPLHLHLAVQLCVHFQRRFGILQT
jgi:hypothetical protein